MAHPARGSSLGTCRVTAWRRDTVESSIDLAMSAPGTVNGRVLPAADAGEETVFLLAQTRIAGKDTPFTPILKRRTDRPRAYRPSVSERSEWVANSRNAGTLDIRFENVPDAVIRPSFMKKTTSHRRTDARRWATTKMVLAPASA